MDRKPVPDTNQDRFEDRHIGPNAEAIATMLRTVGAPTLEDFLQSAIPQGLGTKLPYNLPEAVGEAEALALLKSYAADNRVFRSFLGQGYSNCFLPPVIQRNVFENPGWYTQYTPYQAEISQGRLEALLNFQTMVTDLTGLPLANASLLDEATAAAEAMALMQGAAGGTRTKLLVADDLHVQTIAVLRQRAEPIGVEVIVEPPSIFRFDESVFGAVVGSPNTYGTLVNVKPITTAAHAAGALVAVATDLLALCLVTPPGEQGADVVFGSSQRFGVPLGFGGPHAAFFAVRTEHQRRLPGRLAGLSKDRLGNPAARLTLQTREQHIRRDKATSNICTAQVLLAVMAGMYAVWHGPEGLKRIARRTHGLASRFASELRRRKFALRDGAFFDTVIVGPGPRKGEEIYRDALAQGVNLRRFDDASLGISFDETSTIADVEMLVRLFSGESTLTLPKDLESTIPSDWARTSEFLTHPVFHRHHSETAMLRYLRGLEAKDLSLTHSMIPLGSCTMKLNASAEMFPVAWPEFASIHPFAPDDQTRGYRRLFTDLEKWLSDLTGFAAVSLQPNSGAQGEYAGLLAIRGYHQARGDGARDVCLIPISAHGTNPASASMAGFRVVGVACDTRGNVDLGDLQKKIDAHAGKVAACMLTYPSTHGVYESGVKELCSMVHAAGGQVYFDGANLNALVGHCRPGELGADVCHLNLHKTFCIPHGGGGPGVGPIGVASHLVPYLPSHPITKPRADGGAVGPVAAAPWGSALILVIPWMYLRMMGGNGIAKATSVAVLSANYIAKRLEKAFPTLYSGEHGRVAHECILDVRPYKKSADVEVEDIAKRLMDYGFHAPTMSWPVAGTLMVEPTESEPLEEIDRFVNAMLAIREEIGRVEKGEWDRKNNPLKNAPHTAEDLRRGWDFPYDAAAGLFPSGTTAQKFWPSVSRVDNVYGDRNLFCSCAPVEE